LPSAGLVAWYRGGADLSGQNGPALSAHGSPTPTVDRFGNLGYAYSFASAQTGQYLYATNSNVPSGSSARTVSVWFTTAGDQGTMTMVQTGDTSGTGTFFDLAINATVDSLWGSNDDVNGNVTVTDSNWHNEVVTFDGTVVTIYVDGVEDKAATPAPALNTTAGAPLYIGYTPTIPQVAFIGSIDDVRIYNRVLNTDEIQLLYTGATGAGETIRWHDLSTSSQDYNASPGVGYLIDLKSDLTLHLPSNPSDGDIVEAAIVNDDSGSFTVCSNPNASNEIYYQGELAGVCLYASSLPDAALTLVFDAGKGCWSTVSYEGSWDFP